MMEGMGHGNMTGANHYFYFASNGKKPGCLLGVCLVSRQQNSIIVIIPSIFIYICFLIVPTLLFEIGFVSTPCYLVLAACCCLFKTT